MGIHPNTPLYLRQSHNCAVDLSILIVCPCFVLDHVLPVHLGVGPLWRRPRSQRKAGEDEHWLDAGFVQLAQVTLNPVRKREGHASCRCNEWLPLVRVLQQRADIVVDVDAKASSGQRTQRRSLSELPFANVDCALGLWPYYW